MSVATLEKEFESAPPEQMGSGASSGLAVALEEASAEGLASVLAEVPVEQRLRLQSALEAAEEADGNTAEDTLEVHVSTLSGEAIGALTMPRTAIVAQLKQLLHERDETRTPVSRLCLLLGDRIVSDTDVLNDLLPAGSPAELAFHLVRKHRKVARVSDPGGSAHRFLFKMLLIGDGAVGKSSVLQRFTENAFGEDARTSIGVAVKDANVLVDDATNVKLQIWDTAGAGPAGLFGSERRSITRPEFRGASCIFVVFDTTVRASFEHLPKHLDDAENFGASSTVLISIIGNKADLVDSRSVSDEEATAFAAKLGVSYYSVSAKTGANVEAPFYDLCGILVDRMESLGEAAAPPSASLRQILS